MRPVKGLRFWVAIFLVAVVGVIGHVASASDTPKRTPVVVHVDRGGFHWVDAALGAVAGTAATVLAIGLVALHRQRAAAAAHPDREQIDILELRRER
jgi:hypothetical protein